MPNTPVIVQNGVTIYALGSSVTTEDHDCLKSMLTKVGVGMEMPEHYMDIMTALSGGGPSFVSSQQGELNSIKLNNSVMIIQL